MSPLRVDVYRAWPEGYEAMQQLERTVKESGLELPLVELVKTRASQLNQCAFCIDMHTKDARAAGETEQRLYALSAWRETEFFTERERAALAITEALTLVATSHDELTRAIDAARSQLDDTELAKLTYLVVAINGWNRLAITAAGKVGWYVPGSLD